MPYFQSQIMYLKSQTVNDSKFQEFAIEQFPVNLGTKKYIQT